LEIKGFLETSFIDWPDKICAVLFLPFCNFRCPYCHNHGLILRPEEYETLPWRFIRKRFQTLRGWLDGICVSGGEPTLHPDLPDLLLAIKALGFPVKLDTNGTRPKVLQFLVEEKLVDFVAMDVKAPLEAEPYSRCAGVPVTVEAIRESIALLLSGRVPYQFRTTVVPALHTPEILARMGRELKDAIKWTRQEFRPGEVLDPDFLAGLSIDQSKSVH
jgi:pyruvate formate lyase activating enzyme